MTKKFLLSAIMVTVLTLPCVMLRAQNITPTQQSAVGVWDTGDGAQLETYIQGGKLYGKSLHTQKKLDNNGVCKKCDGDLKNKPFVGMVIMYGFAPQGDGWSVGHLIDQSTGMVVSAIIKTENNGTTMSAKCYIGSPILGQTVVWKRIK
jgi:uncharacterized protein (DUF2147 family)